MMTFIAIFMYPTHPLLQTIKIPYYADLKYKTLGLDSMDHCFDKSHYTNYPDEIDYTFNEIGYRCRPVDRYQGDEILAIGDSFTLGLGVNQKDCWSSQLEYLLDYPVLNFSLNGASNDWMARKIKNLLTIFKPKCIIVHYSFSHRREKARVDWHDNERTESDPVYSGEENLTNWRMNFNQIASCGFPVIHSFITSWHNEPVNYAQLPGVVFPPIVKRDLARDSFHYGAKTHRLLAEKFYNSITNPLVSGSHPFHGT